MPKMAVPTLVQSLEPTVELLAEFVDVYVTSDAFYWDFLKWLKLVRYVLRKSEDKYHRSHSCLFQR